MRLALKYSSRVIGLMDGKLVMNEPSGSLKAADLDHLYKH
jgi:ABC-type phosphate/phosphonate transport system ATPase subunit